ncbi:MAG: hypothetical protein K8S54_02880 [Spirochaetia bacterium]|nr:hypothetical protein [Spirochaetia bacterium]
MYIQLAPGKLKAGVSEEAALRASDEFQKEFVKHQKGIVRRIFLKGKDGTFADLVIFESKDAADRVAAAEQQGNPACMAFFQLWEMDEAKPDMGVLSFEEIKTYDHER